MVSEKSYCCEETLKYVWDLDKDSSLVKEMNRFKTFGRRNGGRFYRTK